MQQQTQNAPPSIPPNAVTTEQIQKYLDDNKNLILAIMETQNLGKLAECAQYQTQLQRNLTYLAAIADASQPQAPPTMPSQLQTPMQSTVRQGHPMQQTPPGMVPQQAGLFTSNLPFHAMVQPQDQQHQHVLHFQQQQQLMQGQMGQRPSPGMMSGLGNLRNMVDSRGTRQDGPEAGSSDTKQSG